MIEFGSVATYPRRLYLARRLAALADGDRMADVWAGKQLEQPYDPLDHDFPSRVALAAAGYLSYQDLSGATVEELTAVGLTVQQASAVLTAATAAMERCDMGYTMQNGRWSGCEDLELSPSAALSADVASSAVEIGGPKPCSLELDVTSVSTDDALDVTIQGSKTGAFGGEERTLATFTQATGVTNQRLSFVGERFIRANYNVTGSSVSIACTLRGEYVP